MKRCICLPELHRNRNRRPIADTVNALLEATRAHAGFALRPAGHQVLANVYRVADLARSFELSGGISFRGFVEELEAQAEKSESAEAPVLEQGAEGVRLMTVHAAKGLEFPVVILADMTAHIAAGDPDRFVDAQRELCATRLLRCAPWELRDNEAQERLRERAEGIRVAYVAATRARDLLVVPALGDEELDGWLSPLNKAIYPGRERYRNGTRARGCPEFGEASVVERPYFTREEPSVKPGLHTPREGQPRSGLVGSTRSETSAARESRIAAAGDSDGGSCRNRIAESCCLPRLARQARSGDAEGASQSSSTFSPRRKRSKAQETSPSKFKLSPWKKPLPVPLARGLELWCTRMLRDAPLDADHAALTALATVHGRLLGATPEETRACDRSRFVRVGASVAGQSARRRPPAS